MAPRRKINEPIDLPSIIRYKDAKSLADALLDNDFTDRCNTLRLIANVVLNTHGRVRQNKLEKLQRVCKPSVLQMVAWALDDKGYMYDTRLPVTKEWERLRAHCHETADKQQPQKQEKIPLVCLAKIGHTQNQEVECTSRSRTLPTNLKEGKGY